MAPLGLTAALVVLMIDSAIELALISSMVGYLHRSGANQYPYSYAGQSHSIHAKPVKLELNHGHTSNGAAGTALILISFGGFLTLFVDRRRETKVGAMLQSNILSAIFSLTPDSRTFPEDHRRFSLHIP